MTEIIILCVFAFLAGFIDSIVGGGGLIQVPALLIVMPNTAIATVFGTNKLASIAGTATSIRQFAKKIEFNWRVTIPTATTAFVFSFFGARIVSLISANTLRPVILALLMTVAVYTLIRKDFGSIHAPKLSPSKQILFGIIIGALLGFYDGFFGPGTGSFLIFAFIGLFGFDFLNASATAKVVNTATNLSALLYFGFTNQIIYSVAVPMAIFNIIGSIVGVRLAILKGSGFVRILFLVVVTAVILKFGYDTFFR